MMDHRRKTREMLYWLSDKSWFEFDPSVKYQYRLTSAAPQYARDSFAKWIKYQEETKNN